MNTYYLVGITVAVVLVVVYLSFEKYRAYKGDRRFRHSCTNPLCNNNDCEMIYLRMQKPVDPLQSRFVRFLSRSDMLLQTQKKCWKDDCARNGEPQLVGTKMKCFGFVKLVFHPRLCKENALPEQFIGPVRSELVGEVIRNKKGPFPKPALPVPVARFIQPPIYRKWQARERQ